MNNALQNFHHIFIDNQVKQTLFLLHGTGGDEQDLLPLVDSLSGKYNFVGLRGNVSEQGMTRFFERSAQGVFNQESIRVEAKKLADFLLAWYEEHQLQPEDIAFVGYSNGANMILAMAFLFPHLIANAVLLHSMLPFVPIDADLQGKTFLVTYGERDQMIPREMSTKMIRVLEEAGAQVHIVSHPGGHEIQRSEVEALERFLGNKND